MSNYGFLLQNYKIPKIFNIKFPKFSILSNFGYPIFPDSKIFLLALYPDTEIYFVKIRSDTKIFRLFVLYNIVQKQLGIDSFTLILDSQMKMWSRRAT